jgi:hypothetical protein
MKFNNETLRAAVQEWFEHESEAKKKYGHISNWDTSKVTDMSEMFDWDRPFNQPLEKMGCESGDEYEWDVFWSNILQPAIGEMGCE